MRFHDETGPLEGEVPTAPRSTRSVAARILWPALGFPAVIAPRPGASRNAADSDATRTICVLLLSNTETLTPHDAARYLRYVWWKDRSVRTIKAGDRGSFSPGDLTVSRLVERGAEDTHGKALSFGADRQGRNGITVSLSKYVRAFYGHPSIGLKYLHEIRVSEEASARLLIGDQFHLFWNNEAADQTSHSNEMNLLLDRFMPTRVNTVGLASQARSFLENGYKYEYGGLHAPYNRTDQKLVPTEVLHPVFVRRNPKATLTISHVSDIHVDVRNDVYARNLERRRAEVDKVINPRPDKPRREVEFNNWNDSFAAVYGHSRTGDLILLTGDLIDYGRGHIGNVSADDQLGNDGQYYFDRNWFLFYYLLASKSNYSRPVYTILGNHDWRLNPYPPFAPSTPEPLEFIHNNERFTEKEHEALLRIAHGPGHKLAFSYRLDVEQRLWKLFRTVGKVVQYVETVVKAPHDSWAALRGKLDFPGSPVYTTDQSIRWYLLVINPFLDYQFAWPAGHQFLMLDYAEDEELGKEDFVAGAVKSYGPRAAKCLTRLQRWHVERFASMPGRAKTIGIHVPPIGPRPSWYQEDLRLGRKKYTGGEKSTYPMPNGQARDFSDHPLLAVRPRQAPFGFAADYGSFVGKDERGNDTREWFIRRLAAPGAGIRAVLSGHIHRQGVLFVHPGQIRLGPREPALDVLLVRMVTDPRAARMLPGSLYVNTTSGGPRGFQYFGYKKRTSEHPGFTLLNLSNDGTIVGIRPVAVDPRPAALPKSA